jgi:hypothetical protein
VNSEAGKVKLAWLTHRNIWRKKDHCRYHRSGTNQNVLLPLVHNDVPLKVSFLYALRKKLATLLSHSGYLTNGCEPHNLLHEWRRVIWHASLPMPRVPGLDKHLACPAFGHHITADGVSHMLDRLSPLRRAFSRSFGRLARPVLRPPCSRFHQ